MRLGIIKQKEEQGTLFQFEFKNMEEFKWFDSLINLSLLGAPEEYKEKIEVIQRIMHQRMTDPEIQNVLEDEGYPISIPLGDYEFGNLMLFAFTAAASNYQGAVEELASIMMPKIEEEPQNKETI